MNNVEAINWNKLDDPFDLQVWDKLTSNFWLDTKIPLSNDVKSWDTMSDIEKTATKRVLTGLTLLDTVQASVGAVSMIPDAITPHEEAVLTFIAAQESIHAKSYSSIFSTLCSSREIDEVFRWAKNDDYLQNKATIVLKHYSATDPLKRKIASVFLESFLFYSSFYLPLYWSGQAKLTNTADTIRLILRDEAVHGAYLGYKFQMGLYGKTEIEKSELEEFAYDLLNELYENEVKYTANIYDELELTEDVKKFLRFNANKALMNLGYDPLFGSDTTQANAVVMSALSPNSGENHDFFSGSGSSYVIGKTEELSDDDFDF